jgi:recombination protein RecA
MAKAKELTPSIRDRMLAGLQAALGKNEDIKLGTADDVELLSPVSIYVPTDIDCLDLLMSRGKGLPCGRFIEMFGGEGSGKTALCQYLIGRFVNKLKSPVHYLDFDKSYDQTFMDCYGVKGEDIFTPDLTTLENGFDYLAAMADVLAEMRKEDPSCPPTLALVDSLAAPLTEAERSADSVEDSQYGGISKAAGKGVRKLRRAISESAIATIFVNEIRDIMNAKGNMKKTKTPGGWALKFAYSMRLEIASWEKIKNTKDAVIAQIVKVTAVKNKHAPKHMTCDLVLSYARGIDPHWTNFNWYKENGFIDSAGTNGFRWGSLGKDSGTFRRKTFGEFRAANEALVNAAKEEIFEKTLKQYEEYGDPAEKKGKKTEDDESDD